MRPHRIDGVTTAYTLDDDNNVIAETNGTDTLRFIRDAGGVLLGFTLNGVKYTYEKNAQGDISGILDSAGNEVVTYAYDTWGGLLSIGGSLSSTVGVKNPFRYRGYYYDTESGLYYLQSRYYNPAIARFISKNDQSYHEGDTGIAANLYAYANNNPVMMSDPDGHITKTTRNAIIGLISGLICQFAPLLIPGVGCLLWFKWGLVFVCVGIQVAVTLSNYKHDISHARTNAQVKTARLNLVVGIVSALVSGVAGAFGFLSDLRGVEWTLLNIVSWGLGWQLSNIGNCSSAAVLLNKIRIRR